MENRRQTQCSNHFAWGCKSSSWEGRRSVQQRIPGKFSFSFYSSCSGRTAAVVLMDEHLSSLAAGVSVRLQGALIDQALVRAAVRGVGADLLRRTCESVRAGRQRRGSARSDCSVLKLHSPGESVSRQVSLVLKLTSYARE